MVEVHPGGCGLDAVAGQIEIVYAYVSFTWQITLIISIKIAKIIIDASQDAKDPAREKRKRFCTIIYTNLSV